MSTISSFRSIKIKHDVHRRKDCMRKFCEFLREHAMKMINFNPTQDEKSPRPTSFTPVTCTNVRNSFQNFLTFIFDPICTTV